jgi:hypothetical protein
MKATTAGVAQLWDIDTLRSWLKETDESYLLSRVWPT